MTKFELPNSSREGNLDTDSVVSGLRSMTIGNCGVRHELNWEGRERPASMCNTEQLFDCCHNSGTKLVEGARIAERIGLFSREDSHRLRVFLSLVSFNFSLLDESAHTCGNLYFDRLSGMRASAGDYNRFLLRELLEGTFDTVTPQGMSARIDREQRELGALRRTIGLELASAIDRFTSAAEAAHPGLARGSFLEVLSRCEHRATEIGLVS